MRRPTTATLALALASACSVQAFSGTHPVVAWSDRETDSLAYLVSDPAASTSNTPSSQQTFSFDSDDLCSLSSILVLSVPGLHYSDLARLAPASADRPGLKAALESAKSSKVIPYVRDHELSRPLKYVRRFERECGAEFEDHPSQNVWWETEGPLSIRVDEIDGLKAFGLVGAEADEGRTKVMERVDRAVRIHLNHIKSPYAVILTALPPSFSSPRPIKSKQPKAQRNVKRQLLEPAVDPESLDDLPETEQEFVDEVLDEIAEEQAFDDMLDRVNKFESEQEDSTEASTSSSSRIGVSDVAEPEEPTYDSDDSQDDTLSYSDAWAEEMREAASSIAGGYESWQKGSKDKDEKNGTSIFAPKEGSGLLHRYVFFTPALVFSLLVSLLVLIPTVLIAVSALTSIETPHGLETKMTGSVGIDPSKQ
ncbi:hypothetical protein JCM10212_003935 [Sporobolomyces blumeae]